MPIQNRLLWPYSSSRALLATVFIWVGTALTLLVSHTYFSWLDASSGRLVMMLTFAAGFVPLLLLLIDYMAGRRAVLDIKGIKLDFSRAEIVTNSWDCCQEMHVQEVRSSTRPCSGWIAGSRFP